MPHRLQTALNADQEEIVVYLRKHLRVAGRFAGSGARVHQTGNEPTLHWTGCCVGVASIAYLSPRKARIKSFKAYVPGYVHMDVNPLPRWRMRLSGAKCSWPSTDPHAGVFIAIKSRKAAAVAGSFLNAPHEAAPFKIKTPLIDNGREFTNRAFGRPEKDASGEHEFDALCQALGIEPRLTQPKHPQTNGVVERFNGRLAQVLKSHRFNSAHNLETTLNRFVWLYIEHLPQRAGPEWASPGAQEMAGIASRFIRQAGGQSPGT